MNIMELIKYLPLTVFLMSARLNGMTDLAWENAFIWAGICTIVIVIVQLHKKVVFDRLMLGVNLFLLIGATAFITEAYSVLHLYGTYKGAALLVCMGLVGLMTTFFTDIGFIGVDIVGKTHIKRTYSYTLLLINGVAIIWAVLTYQYGLLISGVIPFVVLRFVYEFFVGKLEQLAKLRTACKHLDDLEKSE